ncbi:hypothetical protein AYI68_g6991, partial [Smittium mucronatum]
NKSDIPRPAKRVKGFVNSHYREVLKGGYSQNNSQNKPQQRRNTGYKANERMNLPKYTKPDDTDNVEVSIRHLLDGTPQQKLKKLCSMGSDKKVGMSWAQFKDEGRGAFEAAKSVSRHLPNLYFSMQEDFKVRTTYFILHSLEDAQELMGKYIMYDGKKIEFYQTVRYEEKVTVVNIPSFRDMDILSLIKLIGSQLGPLGSIKDISAWAIRGTNAFLPYGIRIFFVKNDVDTELPLFLTHEDGKINLFYQGCKPACSFCKQGGHWKSECNDLKQKKSKKTELDGNNSDGREKISVAPIQELSVSKKGEDKTNNVHNNQKVSKLTLKTFKDISENNALDIRDMEIKLSKKSKDEISTSPTSKNLPKNPADFAEKSERSFVEVKFKLEKSMEPTLPKAAKDMTTDALEDYFGDEKSSELSDLDFSGSDSDQGKIKKEPGLSDDEYYSESDPIDKKYTEAAKNARNGSITINEFMEVENTVFEHLENKRLSHLPGTPMEQ